MALNLISLGAGVQSTTMALMAARGLIDPMPDAAIFADTGDEPVGVYRHLDWLCSGVLPFPVHRVQYKGRLSDMVIAGEKEARPPFFVRTKKGRGMLGRQCTRNYKLVPIRRQTRKLLGVGPRSYVPPGSAVSWVGISVDEIIRAKPSGLLYVVNRHPLLELGLMRSDCLAWLSDHGYPRPPKSSCIYCPYQSDAQWVDRRDNHPEEWAEAVAFDLAIRSPDLLKLYGTEAFVHGSLTPLGEARLSPVGGRESLIDHECEGMCGV